MHECFQTINIQRMRTLKHKLLLLILAVYGGIILLTFAIFGELTRQLAITLGSGYAAKYSLANKSLVQEPLVPNITLARQMAQSPTIRRWVMNETDPIFRKQALEELESYRERFSPHNWFLVINNSLNYYSNDEQSRYTGHELVYNLSPTNTQDAWYFSSITSISNLALNVNYDRGLDVRKVWINAVIHDPDGTPRGMAGTGLDLSRFLTAFIDHTGPGIQHILLDKRLAIQAHRDRSMIDLQSIATPESSRSTIRRILTGEHDLQHLQDAIERLHMGSAAETFFVKADGKRQLLGISYIPDLDWYEVTLLDLNTIIGKRLFIPIVALVILITLIMIGISGWLVNRLVFTPLAQMTLATKALAAGEHHALSYVNRHDEIGTLAKAFEEMSSSIMNHTATLQARIAERTAQLAATNRNLQDSLDKLNQADSKVELLTGMLPVCSSCHRIRDNKSEWQTLDVYLSKKTRTKMTHGICPDCMKKLYPDYSDDEPPKNA